MVQHPAADMARNAHQRLLRRAFLSEFMVSEVMKS